MLSWCLPTHQDLAQGTPLEGLSDPPEVPLCLTKTNVTLLWHLTELEYISAFLFLWHCENLESRSQVWFIQPAPPGGLWVGMGAAEGSEVATDTPVPGLSLTQCVRMGRTEIIIPQSGESQREMKVDLFEQRSADTQRVHERRQRWVIFTLREGT